MFENYVGAKTLSMPKWATPLITGVVIAHAVFFVGLWVSDQWKISLLPVPKGTLEVAIGSPPPPPPPPPPAGKKRETPKTDTPKKVVIKETVQPVQNNEPVPDVVAEVESTEEGVEGGVEGGVAGGVLGGVLGGVEGGVVTTAPKVEPPKAAEPEFIAPQAAEAQRISGEKNIVPDENTKTAITRSGNMKINVIAKICIGSSGTPSSVSIQKPSGYPAYDNEIKSAMKQWRYKPFTVGGKAVSICTTVTFVYTQK
jgi:protein TonB